jgi:hypothetical protein
MRWVIPMMDPETSQEFPVKNSSESGPGGPRLYAIQGPDVHVRQGDDHQRRPLMRNSRLPAWLTQPSGVSQAIPAAWPVGAKVGANWRMV